MAGNFRKPLALNKKRERTAGPEAFAEDTPKCALKKVNYSLILFELEYLFFNNFSNGFVGIINNFKVTLGF
jgi:hypothetical protein